MAEFDLIQRYLRPLNVSRPDLLLGIGDDCALLSPPAGQALAASLDCLNAGVHFPLDTCPFDIGYKALAVNLSDLAAMGAEPLWFMLGLSLPQADADWLAQFAAGVGALATRYQLSLVGGDTTQGPLSISVQIQGAVPADKALRRSGAQVGDDLWVSGYLGDAGAGLALALAQTPADTADRQYLLQRLNRPSPRVELGLALRGKASAAIDISDGLLADLSHILRASGVRACIELEALPLSAPLLAEQGLACAEQLALTAGDDYELCFCLPVEWRDWLLAQAPDCRRIGQILAGQGIELHRQGQSVAMPARAGFEHFQS